jgi:hypothetical protein
MAIQKNKIMKNLSNKTGLQKLVPVANKSSPPKYRVPLPGFVSQKEVGLGSVIKSVTSAVGIKPCEACKKRAAALNARIVFGYNKK